MTHKIHFNDWFSPWSLHLWSDSNIYTTSDELEENGIYSKNKFLFIIDSRSYRIKQKIELTDIHSYNDALLYLKDRLVLCSVNEKGYSIRIIEFD